MKSLKSLDWIKKLSEIPEKDKFEMDLKFFENLDMSNLSIEQIDKEYHKACKVFPVVLDNSWKPNLLNSMTTFRVRRNVDMNKENITLKKTFNYPPDKVSTCNGRANIKEKSVFYGAFDAITAFLESKPISNERLYMTTWKSNVNTQPNFASIFSSNLPIENDFKKYSQKKLSEIIRFCKKIGEDKSGQLELINDYIARWFVKEKEPYCKTSWISNVYYEKFGAEFLIYPSTQKNSKTCCVAYTKQYVDKNLELDKVIEFSIENLSQTKANVKLHKSGNYINGKVVYSETTEDDAKLMNLK